MRLFRFAENANFDFVHQRYVAFFVTAVMVFGSIGLLAFKGLNYGIDFSGGIMMEVQTPSVPDLAKLRAGMDGLGLGAISIQEFGETQTFMVRVPQQQGGTESQQAATEKVRTFLDSNFPDAKVEYRRTEFVGPQVGDELKQAGVMAFLFTVLAIMAYIWVRFEWQFGVAAIVTLIHDTTAVIGLFSLLWMQFDLATLAAVLMVAGYSTNDTVIIFDRIRENRRKFKKLSMKDIVNLSVNQTLARTLATSLTTLLALIALWVFGGPVVRDFVNAMIFGILVGTYSSIYVAGSMLIYMPFKNEQRSDTIEQEQSAA